jgi:hypothetical protein
MHGVKRHIKPMTKRVIISFLLIFFVFLGDARATDQYAGNWNMTSMSLFVKVRSWGEHCGPRPGSYSSNKIRPVEIVVKGHHLIFSKGGTRTDRCGSPNPRLYTISQDIRPGTWERSCQTAKNDPKFENGTYKFVAEGTKKLIYTAVSNFDWTLKGDHCIATSRERRVYVRAPANENEQKPERETGAPTEKKPDGEPACDRPGPIKNLIVRPRNTRIGPGQKTCFKAIGTDEKGCQFPVDATWTTSQNKKAVHGLVDHKGCFRAGQTAADAEGVYVVTAKAESNSGSARITVVFPDLGELFAARLNSSDDEEEEKPPATVTTKVSSTPPVEIKPAKITESDDLFDGPTIILIAAIIAIIGGVIALVFILRKQPLAKTASGLDAWPDAPSPIAGAGDETWQICPTCGMKLPKDALFCPQDRTRLAAEISGAETESDAQPTSVNIGMVCPACHRGYEPGSKFCPHDSEALIPYPEWRKINRT